MGQRMSGLHEGVTNPKFATMRVNWEDGVGKECTEPITIIGGKTRRVVEGEVRRNHWCASHPSHRVCHYQWSLQEESY